MSLAQLQRRLQAHVLSGAPAIIDDIARGGTADPGRRLAVYSHAYRARLEDVLLRDFPGLAALAGDTECARLLADYIAAEPSTHFNIRWCGRGLAQFLAGDLRWSAQPAYAQMAAFEWALTLAFDAADAGVVAAGFIAAIAPADWPRMQFSLQPALQQVLLSCNVAEQRRALDGGQVLPLLSWTATPTTYVIWRRDFRVYHRALAADEAQALAAVMHGASFGTLCAQLAAFHAEDAIAARAVALLQVWLAEHWVATVALGA